MVEPEVLTWPAPAKINLFLHVTGRRPDGYHDIQTLFQLLDWGDEIKVRTTDGPAISRSRGAYGVPEPEDLVIRAAKLLQAETDSRLGAEIAVRKRIPLGSGLGGGSSDAATVLIALNRMWKCGLDQERLAALGRLLGADVPVFVRGRSAMAAGTGEELKPVVLGDRDYLLVFPKFSVSTREMFADPGLKRNSRRISLSAAIAGEGGNDFEPVVRRRFPGLDRIMDRLSAWGRPMITGTGSAVFVRMKDRKSAKSAAKEMKSLYNVRAVRGVDRSPVQRLMDSV